MIYFETLLICFLLKRIIVSFHLSILGFSSNKNDHFETLLIRFPLKRTIVSFHLSILGFTSFENDVFSNESYLRIWLFVFQQLSQHRSYLPFLQLYIGSLVGMSVAIAGKMTVAMESGRGVRAMIRVIDTSENNHIHERMNVYWRPRGTLRRHNHLANAGQLQ